jgi:hypothetical protein
MLRRIEIENRRFEKLKTLAAELKEEANQPPEPSR